MDAEEVGDLRQGIYLVPRVRVHNVIREAVKKSQYKKMDVRRCCGNTDKSRGWGSPVQTSQRRMPIEFGQH